MTDKNKINERDGFEHIILKNIPENASKSSIISKNLIDVVSKMNYFSKDEIK